MLLRALFGFGGFLVGMGLLWLAAFAATFETSPPEWDAEALSLAVIGLAVVGSTVVAAVRPTKRNILIAGAALIAIPLVAQII